MNRIPVILDVDTGIDDALAILLARSCEQLTIIGIACVSGNVSVEDTYRNTRFIAHKLELKVPVAKGAAYPMANKILHAPDEHGLHGLGRLKIEVEAEKHILPASQLYIKLLTEAIEPITIIATGPLTNLAHLIINHPELKPKIKTISFMGGSLDGGNVTKTAEYNAYADPEALNVILKSEIPLIMAGLNLTRKIKIQTKDLKITDPTPVQQIYIDLLDFYCETAAKHGNVDGGELNDSMAVAAVAMPETFVSELKGIQVDVSKGDTRGETKPSDEFKNVLVLTSTDIKAMVKLTVESIRHLRS